MTPLELAIKKSELAQQVWLEKYNWKGRAGCLCCKCWEWCKMGTYDEWHKKLLDVEKIVEEKHF